MRSLDRLIATPRLLEIDHVDLAAPPAKVWEIVRHTDLARSPLIRALFALRAVPGRIAGRAAESSSILIDHLVSTPEHPGFQVLVDDPPREIAVGAIGKVWRGDIPFVHVANEAAYAAFAAPGFIKVAWALSVDPLGDEGARVTLELRVDATDDESFTKFQRYFSLIGPGSRFIRHSALASFAKELGTPEARERERSLPGDELLRDAKDQLDHGITIAATPQKIWPWLVQMGCGRAGYYSIDLLDNAGVRSARELHPEWQHLEVGQSIACVPDGSATFEVLRVEPSRVLVLGGLFDARADAQLPFSAARPERFWQVTWAFVLEPLDAGSTRLHVRARGAFAGETLHAAWIRPVHHMMETAQLRHLRARVEGTLPRDGARDVLEGLGGAARMCLALVTPFLRGARSHWGVDEHTATRPLPGDELVLDPRWSWTHGIEIEAGAVEVWPWIAQVGATRGGFYSYQWLENAVGCDLRNAESVHPEWEAKLGDDFSLHPNMPPLKVVAVLRGRWLVVHSEPDASEREAGRSWVAASWLFFVEPLGDHRCRLLSRFRVAYSDDLATRLSMGPMLLQPIGFAMDRRMLIGVKERAEGGSRRTESV